MWLLRVHVNYAEKNKNTDTGTYFIKITANLKKVKETRLKITDCKCGLKGGLHRTPAFYLTLKPTDWDMNNV